MLSQNRLGLFAFALRSGSHVCGVAAFVVALALAFATPAAAQTIGVQVTPSGGILSSGPFVQGYSFVVVDQPIRAETLGVYDHNSDGLASPHDVGLWNSSGVLLASTTVGAGTGSILDSGFRFEPISAVPLGVGQTYYVASTHLAGDGDEWLFDPASLIVASEITYDSRRFIRSSALVFPFRVGCITCDTGYFGGNFQFQVIPEPNTLLLLSLGIVGLGLRRRARLA